MTGYELAQARRQLGYTRAQFASATGLAASTISRYEMPCNTGQFPIPQWLETICTLWLSAKQKEQTS